MAQPGRKLMILLPQTPKYWDYSLYHHTQLYFPSLSYKNIHLLKILCIKQTTTVNKCKSGIEILFALFVNNCEKF
jgi:hypothetical protein